MTLLLLLTHSTVWAADLPKFSGPGFTCENFSFPGGTLTNFWRYIEEKQGGDEKFSEEMAEFLKADLSELESLMIWTTPEVEKWSRLFVAHRVHQAMAAGHSSPVMKMDMMNTVNYVVAVWREVGFASAEQIKACDKNNPKHNRRVWTPADWSPQ